MKFSGYCSIIYDMGSNISNYEMNKFIIQYRKLFDLVLIKSLIIAIKLNNHRLKVGEFEIAD